MSTRQMCVYVCVCVYVCMCHCVCVKEREREGEREEGREREIERENVMKLFCKYEIAKTHFDVHVFLTALQCNS